MLHDSRLGRVMPTPGQNEAQLVGRGLACGDKGGTFRLKSLVFFVNSLI